MNDLKPCPKCGKVPTWNNAAFAAIFVLFCSIKKLELKGKMRNVVCRFYTGHSEEEAINNWNEGL